MSKTLFSFACVLTATLAFVARGQDPPKAPSPPKPPAFEVPKDWQVAEANSFSSSRFQIGKGDRLATVTVTALSVDGGGLAVNVNRWRNQVGLESLAEQDALKSLQPIKVDGIAGHALDVTGPDATNKATQRILVVVFKRDDQTWFFKIQGPASLVGEQKTAFEGFIKSVHFEK